MMGVLRDGRPLVVVHGGYPKADTCGMHSDRDGANANSVRELDRLLDGEVGLTGAGSGISV